LAQKRHHHCQHGHRGAISTKSFSKQDTRQQSTVMKLKTIVATALINRFALSFLWFVVAYGQKGYCHGQFDEGQPGFLLVVDKLLNLLTFWTADVRNPK
jgi:hypothetical protein